MKGLIYLNNNVYNGFTRNKKEEKLENKDILWNVFLGNSKNNYRLLRKTHTLNFYQNKSVPIIIIIIVMPLFNPKHF